MSNQKERDEKAIEFCIEHKLPSAHIAYQAARYGWDQALDSEAVKKLVESVRYIATDPLSLNKVDLQEALIEALEEFNNIKEK